MTSKFRFFLPATLALLACTESSDNIDASAISETPSFEDVYAGAQRALAQAATMHNVWTPTEKLLQASQAAYGEGRIDEAIQLATEARLQAELAVEQAEFEKDAWHSRVLSE